MKPSIHLLLPLFFSLTSCVTYQYATVSSSLPQEADGQTIIENDSFRIGYRFNGSNCPAVIQVYNKLEVPLWVDWMRSSFVLADGHAIPLVPTHSKVEGDAVAVQSKATRFSSVSIGEFEGTIEQPQAVSFVPPRAFVEGREVALHHGLFKAFSVGQPGNKPERHTFDENTSPLVFRSYVTVSTNGDLSKPIVYDNVFWVSELVTSYNAPTARQKRALNQFYASKSEGLGLLAGVLVVGAVAATAVTGSAALH